jgi:hypothetical protein
MSVDDGPGSVTVCSRGRSEFLTDDLGVTVRGRGRVRRFAWSEISKFADGIYGTQAGSWWELQIVLRSGRSIPVECTRGASAAPEMLAAIIQVAERYGIPADLTGVMIRDGRRPDPVLTRIPAARPE